MVDQYRDGNFKRDCQCIIDQYRDGQYNDDQYRDNQFEVRRP